LQAFAAVRYVAQADCWEDFHEVRAVFTAALNADQLVFIAAFTELFDGWLYADCSALALVVYAVAIPWVYAAIAESNEDSLVATAAPTQLI
jgi:hypothetical protein